MAQILVESIFDKHVDIVKLVKTDDNYKNILQVKIQKEFKLHNLQVFPETILKALDEVPQNVKEWATSSTFA